VAGQRHQHLESLRDHQRLPQHSGCLGSGSVRATSLAVASTTGSGKRCAQADTDIYRALPENERAALAGYADWVRSGVLELVL